MSVVMCVNSLSPFVCSAQGFPSMSYLSVCNGQRVGSRDFCVTSESGVDNTLPAEAFFVMGKYRLKACAFHQVHVLGCNSLRFFPESSCVSRACLPAFVASRKSTNGTS